MTAFDLDPASARGLLSGTIAPGLDDDDVMRRWSLAAWNTLTEPGDRVAVRLIAALGATDSLRELLTRGVGAPGPASVDVSREEYAAAVERWRPRLNPRTVWDSLATARRSGARLLVPEDPEWPGQLADLGDHLPLCLWVRGHTSVLAGLRPSVAIVGARAATGYGEHVASELAAELAGTGIPIVSGAAYGIDGVAHRSALAVGGRTVALLAGGVERPYPAGHAQLIERIVGTGAVASEVPCGSAPTKWRFLQRNRLIAALADATVVVEAGWRSGSLNTAGHAGTLGRALGAVPGPVTSAASAGCHRLLREFDATCITSAADVRELLGVTSVEEFGAGMGAGRPRTDDRMRVRDALSTRAWRDPEDVARRAGMARSEVESILGLLALEGESEAGASGWRRVPGSVS